MLSGSWCLVCDMNKYRIASEKHCQLKEAGDSVCWFMMKWISERFFFSIILLWVFLFLQHYLWFIYVSRWVSHPKSQKKDEKQWQGPKHILLIPEGNWQWWKKFSTLLLEHYNMLNFKTKMFPNFSNNVQTRRNLLFYSRYFCISFHLLRLC